MGPERQPGPIVLPEETQSGVPVVKRWHQECQHSPLGAIVLVT